MGALLASHTMKLSVRRFNRIVVLITKIQKAQGAYFGLLSIVAESVVAIEHLSCG